MKKMAFNLRYSFSGLCEIMHVKLLMGLVDSHKLNVVCACLHCLALNLIFNFFELTSPFQSIIFNYCKPFFYMVYNKCIKEDTIDSLK